MGGMRVDWTASHFPTPKPIQMLPKTDIEIEAGVDGNETYAWKYQLPSKVLDGNAKDEDSSSLEIDSPTIAFINSRSGGQTGPALLEMLGSILGRDQVFDVKDVAPGVRLASIYANLEAMRKNGDGRVDLIEKKMKVVACGGDGTAVWVLKALKDLNLPIPPAMAIIPLGTGNHLSRTLKWGKEFFPEPHIVEERIEDISSGQYADLDSWSVRITGPQDFIQGAPSHLLTPTDHHQSDTENVGAKCVQGVSWNYFSVGVNVEAAYGFHHLRENHPYLAFHRRMNQFWYGFFSCYSGWFCGAPPINRSISIQVQNVSGVWEDVEIPSSVQALVMLNHHSYAGGRDIFGTEQELEEEDLARGIKRPAIDDGKFEIVGLKNGWHTGMVLAGVWHGVRIAQCRAARFEMKAKKPSRLGGKSGVAYFHLDGEPWKQKIPAGKSANPLVVEMAYAGKSKVLISKK